MNPGFYKLENGELLYAPSSVESALFYLSADRRDEYEYPVDGWYWFDSEEAAREALQ